MYVCMYVPDILNIADSCYTGRPLSKGTRASCCTRRLSLNTQQEFGPAYNELLLETIRMTPGRIMIFPMVVLMIMQLRNYD